MNIAPQHTEQASTATKVNFVYKFFTFWSIYHANT